uniref:Ankyrin repeat-containing protein n=1 Tax=Tanacetum cinerariifolium TaxID=118510 RepID=A0A6L2JED9_TANCI|nr:ankyrin repeat-containing protein [Tanacetum cinerariifolium]
MTHKKVADLDNEFEQFKNEFAQHRTYVDEQITTMQNRFTAELGAIRTELTAATSSITAAMERKHEELLKMLSSGLLQSLGIKDESKNGFEESGTLYYNKKDTFPENYIQPEEHDTVERYFEVQDIQPKEKLRAVVLCMEGQALSWFRWSEARSPFRSWEGLKRRLLERFQLSQEGTLYEQFLVITQEGSAREYVNLFETLAGQLVGIPEEVMEGTFIKGLRRALNGVSSQSSSRLAVSTGGQTSNTKEHFRRMTESELEERRAKGLCFRCEEKFKPGHRCAPHTLQVMIVDDSDEENEPYLQVKPWDRALKAD